jgi:hypothetical protein
MRDDLAPVSAERPDRNELSGRESVTLKSLGHVRQRPSDRPAGS